MNMRAISNFSLAPYRRRCAETKLLFIFTAAILLSFLLRRFRRATLMMLHFASAGLYLRDYVDDGI